MYSQHIVLDLEFNPVPQESRGQPLYYEIIEIAAIKLDAEYNEIGRFSKLVKPSLSDKVYSKVSHLTGITWDDLADCPNFETVAEEFFSWVGEGKNRCYSWSMSDFDQLYDECEAKGVVFPKFMMRWTDLQYDYQKLMKLPTTRQFALKNAASYSSIEFDESKAHRALADTEVTVELLLSLVSGEYKKLLSEKKTKIVSDVIPSTFSIANTASGKALAALLADMQDDET